MKPPYLVHGLRDGHLVHRARGREPLSPHPEEAADGSRSEPVGEQTTAVNDAEIAFATNQSLRIPYAKDLQGGFVLPNAALRGGAYHCPECAAAVILRHGRVRIPHFAHRPGIDPANCCYREGGGESAHHRRACHSVRASILSALRRATDIPLSFECSDHFERQNVSWRPPPGSVVYIDHELPQELRPGKRRPDVTVVGPDGTIALAIEVYYAHEVSIEKEVDLTGIRWIEVETRDRRSRDALYIRRHGGWEPIAFECCSRPRPAPREYRVAPPVVVIKRSEAVELTSEQRAAFDRPSGRAAVAVPSRSAMDPESYVRAMAAFLDFAGYDDAVRVRALRAFWQQGNITRRDLEIAAQLGIDFRKERHNKS